MKDSELRIGVNIGKVDKGDRGITVYTRSILGEFGKAGSDCRFVLLHYLNKRPSDNFGISDSDVEFISLPYSDKHRPLATILNEQLINPLHQKRLKLDVVWHPHNRCQLFTPIAYVCTMHDILAISHPELTSQYLGAVDKRALYLTRTRTANHADVIITPSEFERGEIIKHLEVDPHKVVTIYYGVDCSVFKPENSKERWKRVQAKYSLPDRYLLTVGSYAPHKNLRTLIDAYSQSNLSKASVALVMFGPTDATGYRIGYHQTAEYIQRLGIADNVKLLTSAPHEDLAVIYTHATIFAIPSLYESFGLTPLEAMACGAPVVASNAAAMPEVYGSAALYADPRDPEKFANHFNALLDDNNLREQLTTRGRLQASKYDWQKAASKTLDVLSMAAKARSQE